MTHRPSRQFRRVAGQGGVKMSLFDAMIRDFFGADPFIHMRPVLGPNVGPASRPGPRNTGSLPPGRVFILAGISFLLPYLSYY